MDSVLPGRKGAPGCHGLKLTAGKSAGIDDDLIVGVCQDVRNGLPAVVVPENIGKAGGINIADKKADLLIDVVHIQFVYGPCHGDGRGGVRKIVEIHLSVESAGMGNKQGLFSLILLLGGGVDGIIYIEIGTAIFQVHV